MAHDLSAERDRAFRVSLDLHSVCLTDEQFDRLCRDNPDLRLEMSAGGELVIMPPTYTETGWRESRIIQRLANWAEEDGTGLCFGSSTGFRLPNGARRSPDASWLSRSRWEALRPEDRRKMARICPDFVVELRSATDTVRELREKMTEYLENGARLGWLLDPQRRRVYIYRPHHGPERVEDPGLLSGEDVLPGFAFDFREIVGGPV